MSSNERRNEPGEFLKARRTALQPELIGLLTGPDPRRRVAGLRREEVAALASISPDYYTRIEQGRRSAPWSTLNTIAKVLHLDDASRDYLFELSAKNPAGSHQRRAQKVPSQMQRLLDDLTDVPAIILGRRMDILAWNPLAAALITDFSTIPQRHRNYVRLTFTDPAMRDLYADWEQAARLCVGQLHMEVARDPRDPGLAELVGDLSVFDGDFRRWWGDYQVAVRSRGVKHFHHPIVGDLALDWATLTHADDPDQQLVFWSAEPGSPTHRRLRTLAETTRSGPRTDGGASNAASGDR
ncbi:helix-turn-helix domain-containing protein [Arthrobacter sp. NPDC058097]|uniref:helix-turn-helix domain-containing protein n=1 Tax=Arthrobacter sp. NPDC058097 TaxID=3346340 RepID=UPI0036D9C766